MVKRISSTYEEFFVYNCLVHDGFSDVEAVLSVIQKSNQKYNDIPYAFIVISLIVWLYVSDRTSLMSFIYL